MARGATSAGWRSICSTWAILAQGFEVWFKGGTSLSKGFGLIERFSEDLDLKIEPGSSTLPPCASSAGLARPHPTLRNSSGWSRR